MTDENDHNPQWNQFEYQGTVLETAESDDLVFMLPSAAENTISKSFKKRRNFGDIKDKLDDSSNNWELQDEGSAFRSLSSLEVKDIPLSIQQLSVYASLTVTATDDDEGSNGHISYSQAHRGSAASYFSIDSVTGNATVQDKYSTYI